MATQGVTAIHKRRTLWQWLKGYTGQKYMTTALFLAIPVALLILFTIIPAVNMIIFSFQQRDQLGVNVQWVGFDNYKTLFTDMADIFQPVLLLSFLMQTADPVRRSDTSLHPDGSFLQK